MGIMNLLKANWEGKVGKTVGSKWKNKSTIRTFTPPTGDPSPEQERVRTVFKGMSEFIARFSIQMKRYSTLDTRDKSVRNAIIQLNKAQFATNAFDKTTLAISKGGLPNVSGFRGASAAANNNIVCDWTAAVSSILSARAEVAIVVCNTAKDQAWVQAFLNTAATGTVPISVTTGDVLDVYFYLLDYRGSTKVGSPSGYLSVTAT